MSESSRIIFAGSGEFGLPALAALRAAGHEIVLVVSQPDRPAGRNRQLAPTPISRAALDAGLPLLRTADINREALPAADLMMVIAFGQKIGPPIVQHPRLGSINLHASLLPRYRGAAPINWAIIRGETEAGNSIIRLAERMDAGDVLAASRVTIGPTETAGELHDRLSEDGAPLVLRVVGELLDGRATETPQDPAAATMAPKLSRETALLDFSRDAGSLSRLIRGLSPWPGCRVELCDAAAHAIATVRLLRARAVSSDETSRWHAGEIMTDGHIATADGAIEILEVQPDGKRPMSLNDYRRGNQWHAGMHIRSLL